MAFKVRAEIIDGCCGTTLLHIRTKRNLLEKAPFSESYSADEYFSLLGQPHQETDKGKKDVKGLT